MIHEINAEHLSIEHPEVSHTVNGRLLFENFDRLCSE